MKPQKMLVFGIMLLITIAGATATVFDEATVHYTFNNNTFGGVDNRNVTDLIRGHNATLVDTSVYTTSDGIIKDALNTTWTTDTTTHKNTLNFNNMTKYALSYNDNWTINYWYYFMDEGSIANGKMYFGGISNSLQIYYDDDVTSGFCGANHLSFASYNTTNNWNSVCDNTSSDSSWRMYSLVHFSNGKELLYKNGSLIDNKTITSIVTPTTASADYVHSYRGGDVLDEFTIWNTSLNSDNVTTLFNSGKGLPLGIYINITANVPTYTVSLVSDISLQRWNYSTTNGTIGTNISIGSGLILNLNGTVSTAYFDYNDFGLSTLQNILFSFIGAGYISFNVSENNTQVGEIGENLTDYNLTIWKTGVGGFNTTYQSIGYYVITNLTASDTYNIQISDANHSNDTYYSPFAILMPGEQNISLTVPPRLRFNLSQNMTEERVNDYNVTVWNGLYNYTFASVNGNVTTNLTSKSTYNITVWGTDLLTKTYSNEFTSTPYYNLTTLPDYGNATLNLFVYNGTTQILNFTAIVNGSDGSGQSNTTTTGLLTFFTLGNLTYNTTIVSVGFANRSQNLTIPNQTSNYTIQLLGTNNLNISIVDDVTSAILAVLFNVSLQSSALLLNDDTNTGNLYIEFLDANTYNVCAWNATILQRCYAVTIQNQTSNELTIRMPHTTTINYTFYVRSTTNIPVTGATVIFQQAYGSNWLPITSIITDNNGFGYISAYEGGYYRVIISADGYTTRSIDKYIYLILSGEVYLISPSGYSPFVPGGSFVEYYLTPNTTTLAPGTHTLSITTNSVGGHLAWTAVSLNNSLTNVTSSPTGATAAITAYLDENNTPIQVNYSYEVSGYDPTTITLYYVAYESGNVSSGIQESVEDITDTFPEQYKTVWMSIVACFAIAIISITVLQLTNNRLAATFSGVGTLGTAAAFGLINVPVAAICIVIIVGYMVMS